MAKKVLIISSSLRGGSNSEVLAKQCEKGAAEAGNEVEFISLKGKDIRFCIGCMACQNGKTCGHKDDVPEIMEKVKNAQVVVFATPIYYYEMSGQLKTLLDRLNPLFPMEYAFRDIYMIATSAEDGDYVFEKAYNGLQGWVDCFEKAELKGLMTGGEIGDPNDAVNHEDAMKKAYEFGYKM